MMIIATNKKRIMIKNKVTNSKRLVIAQKNNNRTINMINRVINLKK